MHDRLIKKGKIMNKARMESLSDGLFAVVITIMVLQLNVPHATGVEALAPLVPIFLSYLLSFIYGAVFWVKHHHLMVITKRISNGVLWANLNYLFWLSLIPFFTAWVDENHLATVPVAAYGGSLFMVVFSYRLLQVVIMRVPRAGVRVKRVLKRGLREKWSMIVLLLGVLLSHVHPLIAMSIYIAVAIAWMTTKNSMRRAIEGQGPDMD